MHYLIQSLTLLRLFAGPIIFWLLLYTNQYGLTLFLFSVACASDYFDGFLARKYHLESSIGEVLDPIADKVLVLFLVITLALHLQSSFIGFVGAIILAREFWVSALRDINARNNKVNATKVTFLAKLKTSIQFFTFGSFLLGIYLNNSLIIFMSNFFLFISMLIALQTFITYTKASFRD
jgi:CDP-diacylglycerol--glycerol-3-phosphate 3-phosphatidyltransferase